MPHSTLATLLTLAVYVLAAARLTRIVVTDKIGEPIRKAIHDRFGGDSMITYLAFCPWCLGFYVCGLLAFPTALVAHLPWWFGFGLWVAGSYLVGALGRWDSE
jgi:hypothetical protein